MKTTLHVPASTKLFCLAFLKVLLVFTFSVYDVNAQISKDGSPVYNTPATIVINRYSKVVTNANAGDLWISVANINELDGNNTFTNSYNSFATPALSVGDLLLVIQVQGADMVIANDSTYGTITNYNNTGNNEVVSVAGIVGNTISLCSPLQKNYLANGRNRTQIVRMPRFDNVTIEDNVVITAKPWDGVTGGIVSFEANGNISLKGKISASETGFRGGQDDELLTVFGEYGFMSNDPNVGAEKGEGIVGNIADYVLLGGKYCRGAPGNGGGGGNGHNNGGGGGANAGINNSLLGYNGSGIKPLDSINWDRAWDLEGAGFHLNVSPGGGRGGYSFTRNYFDAIVFGPDDYNWGGDDRKNNGGFGGRPLAYSSGELFFGGGGGSGDGNDSSSGYGGRGGGIVYLLNYGNIIGNSGTAFITANGQNGFDTDNEERDGAGGAGAGGAIVILSKNNVTDVVIEANGGNGGRQAYVNTLFKYGEAEGPGGGGGGGYVLTTPTTCLINVNGGHYGYSNSELITEFTANGTTSGASGTIQTGSSPTEINTCLALLADKKLTITGKQTNASTTIKWNKKYTTGKIVLFEIERSTNGAAYDKIGSLKADANDSYSFDDNISALTSAEVFYRVKIVENNGSSFYSNTLRFNYTGNTFTTVSTYPNPATEYAFIKYNMQNAGEVQIRLYDVAGRIMREQNLHANSGLQSFKIEQLNNLSKGNYILQLKTGGQTVNQKMVIR
jgi:Secretion system C-terminal sorting domain